VPGLFALAIAAPPAATLADDQGAVTRAAGGAVTGAIVGGPGRGCGRCCGRGRDRWRGDGAEQDGRRACRALRRPDDHDLGRCGQQRFHPHDQLPRLAPKSEARERPRQ
jgi:hypothetical protein